MISEAEWSTNSSQTLNLLSTNEGSWRVNEQGVSKLPKQNDSLLSPVKVRRKRRQKTRQEQTAEMRPSIDKDHGQIENHFEFKEDNDKRLCGVGEERESATQGGQRRAEQQAGLYRNKLSYKQKAKTNHETSEKQCKLPPLRSTSCNNGTTFNTLIRATAHTSFSSEDSGKLEDELQKPTSISTVGIYDLNDLRKNLKLKKENSDGILKVIRDGSGLHIDRQSSTSNEKVVEKVDKKVRFESLSQQEDKKDIKYAVRTVTFPLQLVKLGHNAATPAKAETSTVVFPRIVDHKAGRRSEPFVGNGKTSHSLAYFRLDHRRSVKRRNKLNKQNDREAVECRGEACFPGFLSLPSLEKVADWLAQ